MCIRDRSKGKHATGDGWPPPCRHQRAPQDGKGDGETSRSQGERNAGMAGVGWLIEQIPVPEKNDEEQAAQKRGLRLLCAVVKATVKSSPNTVAQDGDADQPSRQMEMDDGGDEQNISRGREEVSVLKNTYRRNLGVAVVRANARMKLRVLGTLLGRRNDA